MNHAYDWDLRKKGNVVEKNKQAITASLLCFSGDFEMCPRDSLLCAMDRDSVESDPRRIKPVGRYFDLGTDENFELMSGVKGADLFEDTDHVSSDSGEPHSGLQRDQKGGDGDSHFRIMGRFGLIP